MKSSGMSCRRWWWRWWWRWRRIFCSWLCAQHNSYSPWVRWWSVGWIVIYTRKSVIFFDTNLELVLKLTGVCTFDVGWNFGSRIAVYLDERWDRWWSIGWIVIYTRKPGIFFNMNLELVLKLTGVCTTSMMMTFTLLIVKSFCTRLQSTKMALLMEKADRLLMV